jgi:hypothetical protein
MSACKNPLEILEFASEISRRKEPWRVQGKVSVEVTQQTEKLRRSDARVFGGGVF